VFSIQSREQSDTYEVVPVHDMQAFRGVEVQLHTFLVSALHYMDISGLLHSQALPVPTENKAGCEPELGWTLWSRQSLFPCQESNHDTSADQPVA